MPFSTSAGKPPASGLDTICHFVDDYVFDIGSVVLAWEWYVACDFGTLLQQVEVIVKTLKFLGRIFL